MKILILGAAGQIGRMLTNELLVQTDHELVLYARNASKRLKNTEPERISLVDGEFTDHNSLVKAMAGVSAIYLNDMNSKEGVKTIVKAMKDTGTKESLRHPYSASTMKCPVLSANGTLKWWAQAGCRTIKKQLLYLKYRSWTIPF